MTYVTTSWLLVTIWCGRAPNTGSNDEDMNEARGTSCVYGQRGGPTCDYLDAISRGGLWANISMAPYLRTEKVNGALTYCTYGILF